MHYRCCDRSKQPQSRERRQSRIQIDRSVDLTKQTASNTYASVSAALIMCPFIAPAAAAAGFAAVLTFDRGSIMPQDDMAALHKNEMMREPSRQRSDLSLQSKPQRAYEL